MIAGFVPHRRPCQNVSEKVVTRLAFGAQVINRRIVASGQPAMGLRNLQVRLTQLFPEVMFGFRQLIYLII